MKYQPQCLEVHTGGGDDQVDTLVATLSPHWKESAPIFHANATSTKIGEAEKAEMAIKIKLSTEAYVRIPHAVLEDAANAGEVSEQAAGLLIERVMQEVVDGIAAHLPDTMHAAIEKSVRAYCATYKIAKAS